MGSVRAKHPQLNPDQDGGERVSSILPCPSPLPPPFTNHHELASQIDPPPETEPAQSSEVEVEPADPPQNLEPAQEPTELPEAKCPLSDAESVWGCDHPASASERLEPRQAQSQVTEKHPSRGEGLTRHSNVGSSWPWFASSSEPDRDTKEVPLKQRGTTEPSQMTEPGTLSADLTKVPSDHAAPARRLTLVSDASAQPTEESDSIRSIRNLSPESLQLKERPEPVKTTREAFGPEPSPPNHHHDSAVLRNPSPGPPAQPGSALVSCSGAGPSISGSEPSVWPLQSACQEEGILKVSTLFPLPPQLPSHSPHTHPQPAEAHAPSHVATVAQTTPRPLHARTRSYSQTRVGPRLLKTELRPRGKSSSQPRHTSSSSSSSGKPAVCLSVPPTVPFPPLDLQSFPSFSVKQRSIRPLPDLYLGTSLAPLRPHLGTSHDPDPDFKFGLKLPGPPLAHPMSPSHYAQPVQPHLGSLHQPSHSPRPHFQPQPQFQLPQSHQAYLHPQLQPHLQLFQPHPPQPAHLHPQPPSLHPQPAQIHPQPAHPQPPDLHPEPPSLQGLSGDMFEQYRRWQSYRGVARHFHADSSVDAEALACFFVPVIRRLYHGAPSLSLLCGVDLAVEEWRKLSNFDRMEYYQTAHKFLEFERTQQRWKELRERLKVTQSSLTGEDQSGGLAEFKEYTTKKAALRNPDGNAKTQRGRNSSRAPRGGGQRNCRVDVAVLEERALTEYMEIMEVLEARKKPGVKGHEEEEDRGEKVEEDEGEKMESGLFLEYLGELCGQRKFVTEVGAELNIGYLNSLISSEPEPVDLLAPEETQEEHQQQEADMVQASPAALRTAWACRPTLPGSSPQPLTPPSHYAEALRPPPPSRGAQLATPAMCTNRVSHDSDRATETGNSEENALHEHRSIASQHGQTACFLPSDLPPLPPPLPPVSIYRQENSEGSYLALEGPPPPQQHNSTTHGAPLAWRRPYTHVPLAVVHDDYVSHNAPEPFCATSEYLPPCPLSGLIENTNPQNAFQFCPHPGHFLVNQHDPQDTQVVFVSVDDLNYIPHNPSLQMYSLEPQVTCTYNCGSGFACQPHHLPSGTTPLTEIQEVLEASTIKDSPSDGAPSGPSSGSESPNLQDQRSSPEEPVSSGTSGATTEYDYSLSSSSVYPDAEEDLGLQSQTPPGRFLFSVSASEGAMSGEGCRLCPPELEDARASSQTIPTLPSPRRGKGGGRRRDGSSVESRTWSDGELSDDSTAGRAGEGEKQEDQEREEEEMEEGVQLSLLQADYPYPLTESTLSSPVISPEERSPAPLPLTPNPERAPLTDIQPLPPTGPLELRVLAMQALIGSRAEATPPGDDSEPGGGESPLNWTPRVPCPFQLAHPPRTTHSPPSSNPAHRLTADMAPVQAFFMAVSSSRPSSDPLTAAHLTGWVTDHHHGGSQPAKAPGDLPGLSDPTEEPRPGVRRPGGGPPLEEVEVKVEVVEDGEARTGLCSRPPNSSDKDDAKNSASDVSVAEKTDSVDNSSERVVEPAETTAVGPPDTNQPHRMTGLMGSGGLERGCGVAPPTADRPDDDDNGGKEFTDLTTVPFVLVQVEEEELEEEKVEEENQAALPEPASLAGPDSHAQVHPSWVWGAITSPVTRASGRTGRTERGERPKKETEIPDAHRHVTSPMTTIAQRKMEGRARDGQVEEDRRAARNTITRPVRKVRKNENERGGVEDLDTGPVRGGEAESEEGREEENMGETQNPTSSPVTRSRTRATVAEEEEKVEEEMPSSADKDTKVEMEKQKVTVQQTAEKPNHASTASAAPSPASSHMTRARRRSVAAEGKGGRRDEGTERSGRPRPTTGGRTRDKEEETDPPPSEKEGDGAMEDGRGRKGGKRAKTGGEAMPTPRDEEGREEEEEGGERPGDDPSLRLAPPGKRGRRVKYSSGFKLSVSWRTGSQGRKRKAEEGEDCGGGRLVGGEGGRCRREEEREEEEAPGERRTRERDDRKRGREKGGGRREGARLHKLSESNAERGGMRVLRRTEERKERWRE